MYEVISSPLAFSLTFFLLFLKIGLLVVVACMFRMTVAEWAMVSRIDGAQSFVDFCSFCEVCLFFVAPSHCPPPLLPFFCYNLSDFDLLIAIPHVPYGTRRCCLALQWLLSPLSARQQGKELSFLSFFSLCVFCFLGISLCFFLSYCIFIYAFCFCFLPARYFICLWVGFFFCFLPFLF